MSNNRNRIVFPAEFGRLQPQLAPAVQGGEPTYTLYLVYQDGTVYPLADDDVLEIVYQDTSDDEVYSTSTGLSVSDAEAGIVTWEAAAALGLAGSFRLQLKVNDETSLRVNWKVEAALDASGTTPPVAMTSLTAAEAEWVQAGKAAGDEATAGNLVQFNNDGTLADSGRAKTEIGNATQIRSRPVADVVPIDGQVMTFDTANGWQPETPAGGGVTDHGALTGLGDDDHTQYAKRASNLSDLTDAAAARSAIGAGTGNGDLLASNNLSELTATASTARTNLGLAAGGAGDIWVEKAGDTMTGPLLMGTNYFQAQHFRPVSSTYYFESSAGATSYYAIWETGRHRLFFNSNPASAPSAVIEINARAVGAAQDNFGASIEWKLETSTINDVPAGRMGVQWQTATHASRVPDMVAYLTDSADEREIWRGRANGSAAAIGFLGATPVARQAHIADPSGGATQDAEARTAINAILVVLENLGFTATS